jgi:TP901 family phage tail tape measure protein
MADIGQLWITFGVDSSALYKALKDVENLQKGTANVMANSATISTNASNRAAEAAEKAAQRAATAAEKAAARQIAANEKAAAKAIAQAEKAATAAEKAAARQIAIAEKQALMAEKAAIRQAAAAEKAALAAIAAAKKQEAANEKAALTSQNKWHSSLNQIGYDFQRLGMTATMFLTAPILLLGRSVLKTASDLEFATTKITALSGVGSSMLSSWSGQINTISDTTARTKQELADALYFITSSGIKSAEALRVLETSAKASASGLGETKDISRLLVSVMNAYGKETITASRAGDILTASVREGTAEAVDMANQIGKVIPEARMLGVSFAQVAGATAAMTLNGMNAAQATTALRQIFVQLLKNSEAAQGLIGKERESLATLRAELKNGQLVDVLAHIDEIMKSGNNTLAQFFGNVRSLTGGLSLTGESLQRTKDVIAAVEGSAGDLNKAWRVMDNTIQNQLKHATTALNNAFVALGASMRTSLIAIFKDVTEKIKSFTNWYTNLTESAQKSLIIWASVAAAIGPISLFITFITRAIVGLRYILVLLIGTVRLLGVAMTLSGIGPIIRIATAIGILIPVLISMTKHNEEVSASEKALGDSIKKVTDEINDNYTAIQDMMGTAPKMNIPELTNAEERIQKEIDFIKNRYEELKKTLQGEMDKDPFIMNIKLKMASSDPAIKNSYEAGTPEYLSNKTGISVEKLTSNPALMDSLLIVNRQEELLKKVKQLSEADQKELNKKLAMYAVNLAELQRLKEVYVKLEAEFIDKENGKKINDIWSTYEQTIARIKGLLAAFSNKPGINIFQGILDLPDLKVLEVEDTLKAMSTVITAFAGTAEEQTPRFKKFVDEYLRMGRVFREQAMNISVRQGTNGTVYNIPQSNTSLVPKDLTPVDRTVVLMGKLESVTNAYNDAVGAAWMKGQLLGQSFDLNGELIQANNEKLKSLVALYLSVAGNAEATAKAQKLINDTIKEGSALSNNEIMDKYAKTLSRNQYHYQLTGDRHRKMMNDIQASIIKVQAQMELPTTTNEQYAVLDVELGKLQKRLNDVSGFQKFAEQFQKYAAYSLTLVNSYTAYVDAKKNQEYALIEAIALKEHRSAKWLANEKLKIDAEYGRKKKQLAIAEVAINTAVAITSAFAQLGPIGGAIASAFLLANAAIQVATINATPMAQGGIVPAGYNNDTYPARLSSGEMVIPPHKLPSMFGNANKHLIVIKGKLVAEGRDMVYSFGETEKLINSY